MIIDWDTYVRLKPTNPAPSKQSCEKLKKHLNRKSLAKPREDSGIFIARAVLDHFPSSDREIGFQIGDILSFFDFLCFFFFSYLKCYLFYFGYF